MIILDSDIVIDFLRRHQPAIDWLITLGDEEIALPGYVVMELIQGCGNKTELRELRRFIADFEIVWPSAETCDRALVIFSQYNLSHNLGLLDALIGQTSIALDLPLYTFNQSNYSAGRDYVRAKEQDLQNSRIMILSFRKSCSEMGHKRHKSPYP